MRPHDRSVPRALSIAGSDSGGGAGIQADLATFAAHGVFGTTAVVAVTAQNTLGVRAVETVSPSLVVQQIDAVVEDIGVDAIKIGMLANAELVRAVAERLAAEDLDGVPIVLDPVMVASSGDALLEPAAVTALRETLVPLATLVTPNLPEAARLAELPSKLLAEEGEAGLAARRQAAERLRAGVGTGSTPAVLIKGGHGQGQRVVDLLVTADGARRFDAPRLDPGGGGRTVGGAHGTGCTLSSAVAARLARGESLVQAVEGALAFVHRALDAARPVGGGPSPLHHFFAADLKALS
ncbi:MAG: bifunctional hydroxymethylpyrimidine kinase/phosphomethylpyrimidine kinase [Acidobacteriota bacterium]